MAVARTRHQFAVSGDGETLADPPAHPRPGPLRTITAADAHHGWGLFDGPKGQDASFLYTSGDAGAHWHQMAGFTWPH